MFDRSRAKTRAHSASTLCALTSCGLLPWVTKLSLSCLINNFQIKLFAAQKLLFTIDDYAILFLVERAMRTRILS